jgi:hypothetical protein
LTPEELLSFVSVSLEIILIALMMRSRAFRALPIFFSYLIWNLCSGAVVLMLLRILSPDDYLRFYLAEMTLDALFEFAFLAELARVVRRHNPAVPARTNLGILMILPAILLIVPLAAWTVPQYFPILYKFYVHLQQAFAVLRVAFVLALVWWSSLLGMRWSDRELRIATGFGFYSIVALAVAILHTHQAVGPLYHWLDEVAAVSYLAALAYWILAFPVREPKPRAFLSTNA